MRSVGFIVSVLALVTFSSCSGEEEQVPEYVWEEERFIEVLTEFQKAESIVRLGYHKLSDSIYPNDSVYQSLFVKMGVLEHEFDSNYQYYLNDPERMEKIYDQVITNLSKQEAELQ